MLSTQETIGLKRGAAVGGFPPSMADRPWQTGFTAFLLVGFLVVWMSLSVGPAWAAPQPPSDVDSPPVFTGETPSDTEEEEVADEEEAPMARPSYRSMAAKQAVNRILMEGAQFMPNWTASWQAMVERLRTGYGVLINQGLGIQRRRPLDVYENEKVRQLLRVYQEGARLEVERGLARSGEYLPMIRRIFAEEGLPVELSYLAVVESNLNPRANSRKKATGLWQFMPNTARHFGLRVESTWYDERLDPELSTRAAARMLAHLYDKYGTWELSLAAYNGGEGRLDKAIRAALSKGKGMDFWELALPHETRVYVPSFLAMVLLYNDLEDHGFDPVEPLRQPRYDLAPWNTHGSLPDLEQRLGLTPGTLAALNPAWQKNFLPSSITQTLGSNVVLRLPGGGLAQLKKSIRQVPLEPPALITHRVTNGETTREIARFYRVSVWELRELNNLTAGNPLQRGQSIQIPLLQGDLKPYALASLEGNGRGPAPRRMVHRARSSDTLDSIAAQFRVTPAQLVQWNALTSKKIAIRQELVIFLHPSGQPAKHPARLPKTQRTAL